MKISRLAITALICASLGSCSSRKEITYFQDIPAGSENIISKAVPLKLKANDKVSIIVSTSDPRLNSLFNLPVSTNRIGSSGTTTSGNGEVTPYTIDSHGDIDFPVLGKLHIAGMTREQVAEYVRRELISRDLAKNPIVTVDFLNLGVSVIGEVQKPGRVEIPREDFTILDAIASSGDLTIYGRRDNVKVFRDENGVQKVYTLNLNSGAGMTQSPVYYLQQNDVVYVEPNSVKARQSTANGNSWLTPTFWISIASFLTTIGILIFNK